MKKRILISAEQHEAQVGSFFQNLGIELCVEYDKTLTGDYLFIVDDYLPDIKFLPRLQTRPDILESCQADVRASFDEVLINQGSIKKLLSSYFTDAKDFNLVDQYSNDYKNIYSLKVHDYLNIGYFIDSIVVEAYKNDFDFDKIRDYLNSVLPYFLKQIEKEKKNQPLEVSFSHSDEGFAVQVSMSIPDFDLKKNFKNKSANLAVFAAKTNFFDVSYFKKREQLFIASLWFKDKMFESFKSSFYSEISARTSVESDSSIVNVLDENQEEVFYVPAADTALVNVKSNIELKLTTIKQALEKKTLNDLAVIKQDNLTEDENTRVKGWIEDKSEDDWKIKRSELLEKISDEVRVIQSLGQNVEEEDLIRIIASELNVKDDDVKFLVKGIVVEAAVVENVLVTDNSKDKDKDKREAQITRMKDIMERMKAELVKVRAEADELRLNLEQMPVSVPVDQSYEVGELKKALTKTIDILRNKEKAILKMRYDFEQIHIAKETKIHELEVQMLDAHNRELLTNERIDQVLTENKALLGKVELATSKINNINGNMGKEIEIILKKDKEIATLKGHVQITQALVEKYQQEKNELELRLRGELDKDMTLPVLMAEKKVLEEKFRAQGMELKKQEHKLKFVMAQLEESQRKKLSQPVQAAKTSDAYLKQLENANVRLGEAGIELAEKKKEIIKLKQENVMLTSKLSDLDRKINIIEKKIA